MRPPLPIPQPLRGGGVETPNVALTKDDFIVHYNPKVIVEYETVDMGNGILWATSNITRTADGSYKVADNPWDYGCYFSWGDVVGHNSEEYNDGYSFSSDNYSSGASGLGHNLTATFTSGNPTYDAATATLGGNWRMPTYDEYKWLIDNCNLTWVTRNGVNGKLFTNPNDSSKTLFFPAVGYYSGTALNSATGYGGYWTTKYYDSSYAYHFAFDAPHCSIDPNFNRSNGFPVRAVKSV